MSSVALWTGLSSVGCFLACGFWGKVTDRARTPYRVLWVTGHLIALSPVLYAFASNRTTQLLAPFEYLTYGLYSAGFALAQTSMLFRVGRRGNCAAYFALFAAVCGLSGIVGTFAGGALASALAARGGFRALFLISGIARFGALWGFCRDLAGVRISLEALDAGLAKCTRIPQQLTQRVRARSRVPRRSA
jgi:hypothetical protein